jgi:hypothetical protein
LAKYTEEGRPTKKKLTACPKKLSKQPKPEVKNEGKIT